MTVPSAGLGSEEIAYFGYGSLVNEFTWARSYQKVPAEIQNWRREWKHCVDASFGRICALTVSRELSSRIQGVFIKCSLSELKAVDNREIGYERVEMPIDDVVDRPDTLPSRLFIYRSTPASYRLGSREYPLWLSYIEVVMDGYLQTFGDAGLDRFIATTSYWATPILDDRELPKYPRARQLPVERRLLFERKLFSLPGVSLFQIEEPTDGKRRGGSRGAGEVGGDA
jgi:hypothetical protein